MSASSEFILLVNSKQSTPSPMSQTEAEPFFSTRLGGQLDVFEQQHAFGARKRRVVAARASAPDACRPRCDRSCGPLRRCRIGGTARPSCSSRATNQSTPSLSMQFERAASSSYSRAAWPHRSTSMSSAASPHQGWRHRSGFRAARSRRSGHGRCHARTIWSAASPAASTASTRAFFWTRYSPVARSIASLRLFNSRLTR